MRLSELMCSRRNREAVRRGLFLLNDEMLLTDSSSFFGAFAMSDQKIKKIIVGLMGGLKSVYTMKKFGAFILHTFIMWSMYFLMTWLMCFALPETSSLKPIDGLFLLVIGSLGMAAPVQGGIGAFHWLVSLGLTLYGIPREKGLVYATLNHESQTLLLIILGSIAFILVFLKKKKTYLAPESKTI